MCYKCIWVLSHCPCAFQNCIKKHQRSPTWGAILSPQTSHKPAWGSMDYQWHRESVILSSPLITGMNNRWTYAAGPRGFIELVRLTECYTEETPWLLYIIGQAEKVLTNVNLQQTNSKDLIRRVGTAARWYKEVGLDRLRACDPLEVFHVNYNLSNCQLSHW